MQLLVATAESQGQRSNDFSFPPEGELVIFALECDGEGVDGSCGCVRSMVGIDAKTATTTMKVAEVAISFEQLKTRIAEHYAAWKLKNAAWSYRMEALDLIHVGSHFPLGAIVEKRAPRQDEAPEEAFRIRRAA